MSQLILGKGGPRILADGGVDIPRLSKDAGLVTQDGHGRYTEPAYRGGIFSVSLAAAAAITAYTGGAGGTPALAIWNPKTSNKVFNLLAASFGQGAAASAAGVVTWNLFFGPTADITQATRVIPSNASGTPGGSSGVGFSNAALTSSTALANLLSLGYYYWATAAAAAAAPSFADLGGLIQVPPGCMAAIGGTAALTSATWTASLFWEELPV